MIIFHGKERNKMKKSIWIIIPLMTLMLATPAFTEPVAETWVTMKGVVNLYAGEPAFGWCGVYAKIGEWARANIFWMQGFGMPPIEENFTISFHAARLVNTTIVGLNYAGNDFYVSGLWDVYNITLTAISYNTTYTYHNHTVKYTRWNVTYTTEPWVTNRTGELYVTGNWTAFAVDITDIDLISGIVVFRHEGSIGPIPIGDVYGSNGMQDCKVDIWDLQHLAHNYGSTPVLNFDFTMDLNFDFKIDIYDLTTIAVNIGESY